MKNKKTNNYLLEFIYANMIIILKSILSKVKKERFEDSNTRQQRFSRLVFNENL